MKLRCTTAEYGSNDINEDGTVDLDHPILVHEGDEFEVSDAKGEQMLRDFPEWFEKVAGRRSKPKD